VELGTDNLDHGVTRHAIDRLGAHCLDPARDNHKTRSIVTTVSQSTSPIVLTGPGQGVIVDLYGVAWQISADDAVIANNIADADLQPVVQLTFVGGRIWRQTKTDLRWSSKVYTSDPWSPSTETSPLPGPVTDGAELIDRDAYEMQSLLVAIATLQADFDAWKAQPTPTDGEILQAIGALQTDLDPRLNTITTEIDLIGSELQIIVPLLDQIITNQAGALNAANSNQNVLVVTLNQIVASQSENQAACIALLTQLVNAVTGTDSTVAVIAQLQQDFIALMQANAVMQASLNAILTILNAPTAPNQIVLDTVHFTTTLQAVPSRDGP
jgi:hypothetical protein